MEFHSTPGAGAAVDRPPIVRAIFAASPVEGATAPYDRVHVRVHYPAVPPSDPAEFDSGMLAPDPRFSPLPLVVVAPGVNCGPEAYQWIAHGLAARGFATVTYSFLADTPRGTMLVPDDGFAAPSSNAVVTSAIVALMRRISTDSVIAGALAPERLALVGHSAGGRTALYLSQHDELDLRAVVGLGTHAAIVGDDGTPTFPVLRPRCPVLLISGGSDGVIARSSGRYGHTGSGEWNPTRETFEQSLPESGGSHQLVELPMATHFTFVDPGDPATGRAFLEDVDPNGAPHRAIVLGVIAAFLSDHLGPSIATVASPLPPEAIARRR